MSNQIEDEEIISSSTLANDNKKISVKKNYIFNLLYQLFLIVVPLITTPYVSRVLTANGVGQYSFSFSLATYFTIFAGLGFGYYAQRAIAKQKDNKEELSITFWEIIICRLFPVVIALSVNILFCLLGIYREYTPLMWVFNINIFAVSLDISFLYQGKEEFGSLVIKNLLIKTTSVILIFVFVVSEKSLIIYTIINASSVLLSNIFMWISIKKMLVKVKVHNLSPLRHMKGTIVLFLPTIAVSIYTVLDKTLIGLLITDTYEVLGEDGVYITKNYSDLENGYYEQSEKIVKMAMVFITSIASVMIPRNSNELALGHIDTVRKNIYTSCRLVLLFGIPLMLGLIAVSDNLVPWFLGNEYEKSSFLIKLLSPLVIIIGFSNVFGLQFLIPAGKDRIFTIALTTGAAINLLLNIFFIKLWWSNGAAIATLVAEAVVTLITALAIRKEINFLKVLLSGWKYLISGIIMFVICLFISTYLSPSIVNTLLITLSGILSYFIFLIIFQDKLIIISIKKITLKIKKKNQINN